MTDTIQKIRSFERFGSKLGLERMERLMDRLGNPQEGMNFIHVAGTNGKGSVCRFIYEILRENGYRAGLFTSPYIQLFNERIEFDGRQISGGDLETCAGEVLAQAEEMTGLGLESPTEFEIVTAIAFVYFKKKAADYVILEVGLGGSGDSTNIIKKPLVSVITSISFDHTERLGDTLEAIAGEKAGIIKESVPVVSNVTDSGAAKVIARTAYKLGAVLYDVTKPKAVNVSQTLEKSSFDVEICGTGYSGAEISMAGGHQIQNALTALTAVEVLRKKGQVSVCRDGLYRGLRKARQLCRFEIFGESPYFILDGAHNENGAEALKNTMKELFPGKKTLMVAGILADKDVKGMLRHFYEIADDFIASEPENGRKLCAAELSAEIRSAGKNCMIVPEPVAAYEKAAELGGNYDVLLFAGSLYLLGQIRGCF